MSPETSVGREGPSLPHPGSAVIPLQPGRSLPSSPRRFTYHISRSTSSNLSSPEALLHGHCTHPVRALAALLHDFGYYAGLFSLHSLCRGGAMVAYWQGSDQIDIKHQGLWTSDAFWRYIISSCAATSPLTARLARPIEVTISSTSTTASTSSYHSSSSTQCHHQVTICHSSSPHHSHHHHQFMCGNHALSGFSNLALSGCSELQPYFVVLCLTSKVNLG